ncbi:hypothetical protein [Sphingomonas hengshuiensis]|nr:hypothetical protein [Sphingomonas hengshuiensis]
MIGPTKYVRRAALFGLLGGTVGGVAAWALLYTVARAIGLGA